MHRNCDPKVTSGLVFVVCIMGMGFLIGVTRTSSSAATAAESAEPHQDAGTSVDEHFVSTVVLRKPAGFIRTQSSRDEELADAGDPAVPPNQRPAPAWVEASESLQGQLTALQNSPRETDDVVLWAANVSADILKLRDQYPNPYDTIPHQHIYHTEASAAHDGVKSGAIAGMSDLLGAVEAFHWSPGGVRGASLAEVEAAVERLYQKTQHTLHGATASVCSARGGKATRNRRSSSLAETVVSALTKSFSTLDSATGSGDDCRYQLPAYHRAVCLLLAIVEDTTPTDAPPQHEVSANATTFAEDGSLHTRKLYRKSLCSTLVPCASWARGTFSITLSAQLLERVYENIVVPFVLGGDSEASLGVAAFSKQLLHGEGNLEEFVWLARRTEALELEAGRRQAVAASSRLAGKVRHRSLPLVVQSRQSPAVDVLQGEHVGFSHDAPQEPLLSPPALPVTRDTAGAAPARPLEGALSRVRLRSVSPLEILSILVQVVVGPVLDADERIQVMLVSGDSSIMEVFERLVQLIRYGDGRTQQAPSFHFPVEYDMVYAVHATHDELLAFDPSSLSPSSENTVEAFFLRLRRGINRAHPIDRDSVEPKSLALLYIVWMWNPEAALGRSLGSLLTAADNAAMTKGSPLGIDTSTAIIGVPSTASKVSPVQLSQTLYAASSLVQPAGTSGRNIRTRRDKRLIVLTSPIEDPLGGKDNASSWWHHEDDVAHRTSEYPDLKSLSAASRNNLAVFQWLEKTNLQRLPDQMQNTSRNHSGYYFNTVQVLDKAKIPFLFGTAVHKDPLHFSCRGSLVEGEASRKLYEPQTLRELLTPRNYRVGVNREDFINDRTPILGRRLCNSTKSLTDFISEMGKYALGSSSVSGQRGPGRRGADVDVGSSTIPSSLFHQVTVSPRRTVYMFPNSGHTRECTDYGHQLLLHVLVQNAVFLSNTTEWK